MSNTLPITFFDGHMREAARALDAGNEARVRRLVNVAFGIHDRGRQGITLLWYAVLTENREAIRLLVELGSEPDGQKIEGKGSPLQATLEHEDARLLDAILDGGLSPNYFPKEGQPLLHRAILGTNPLPKVKLLVERGADVNEKNPDENNMMSLHQAVFGEQFGVATYLVRKNADFSAETDRDISPLWVVYWLLESGRAETEQARNDHHEELDNLRSAMCEQGAAWPPETSEKVRESMQTQGVEMPAKNSAALCRQRKEN